MQPLLNKTRALFLGASLAAILLAVAAALSLWLVKGDGNAAQIEPPRASGTLAFVRGKEGESADIYTARANGSHARRLTRGPGFKYDPDWSPDGKRLLYRYEPPGPPAQRPGRVGLVVMRADGTGALDIATRAGVFSGPASWGPSGDLIAFSGGRPGQPSGIYTVRSNLTHLRRLTPRGREAQYPAWSPDGRKIAFTYVDLGASGFSIYIMDADGANSRRLTAGPEDNWPAWSPDSGRIAFSRGDSIWVMRADGSQPRLITTRGGAPLNWSPSANLVFACPLRAGVIGACAISPDGRRIKTLLAGTEGGFPAWRPRNARSGG